MLVGADVNAVDRWLSYWKACGVAWRACQCAMHCVALKWRIRAWMAAKHMKNIVHLTSVLGRDTKTTLAIKFCVNGGLFAEGINGSVSFTACLFLRYVYEHIGSEHIH